MREALRMPFYRSNSTENRAPDVINFDNSTVYYYSGKLPVQVRNIVWLVVVK